MVYHIEPQEGPKFQWPNDNQHPHHHQITFPEEEIHPTTDTTADDVVHTIKNIVNTFIDTQTTPTTSTTTQATLLETLGIDGGTMNEIVNTNTNITSQLNPTVMTEMIGSNKTVMEFNNTAMNEITTMLPTNVQSADTSGIISSTVKTVVDKMVTSTEKVFATIADIVTPSSTTRTNLQETLGMDGGPIDEIVNNNITSTQLDPSVITEMIGSNKTVMEFNNTAMDEMANITTVIPTTVESEDTTGLIASSVKSVVDTMVTTTEKVFNTIADIVTPPSTTTLETTSEDVDSGRYGDSGEEKTLYIVVGVILGALILLMIILLIIYKRYKMLNTSTNVYCVTDLNEVSVSSCKERNARM